MILPIESFPDFLTFHEDNWCPEKYWENLLQDFDNLDVDSSQKQQA